MMGSTLNLSNQLLIAMPGMADPNFANTVTLVCEHTEEGALGLIINQLLETQLGEVLSQMGLNTDSAKLASSPIYHGGPVEQNLGFVLHQSSSTWPSELAVSDTLALSSSQEILKAIAAGNGPDQFLVALGYAGWGPGQLERELLQNTWLTLACDLEILFETRASQRLQVAAARLGVNLQLLSPDVGHG